MSKLPIDELIFVYNADGHLFASLADLAHKIFSPKTYVCNLCKVTYGTLSMKSEWKDYLAQLPVKKFFLHRDEFAKAFAQFKGVTLPLIIAHDAQKTYVLVSARELNQLKDIRQLIQLINLKLDIRVKTQGL